MFEAVENIKKNNKVRSVIICSLVPGIFCAGTPSLSCLWYGGLLMIFHVYYRKGNSVSCYLLRNLDQVLTDIIKDVVIGLQLPIK